MLHMNEATTITTAITLLLVVLKLNIGVSFDSIRTIYVGLTRHA